MTGCQNITVLKPLESSRHPQPPAGSSQGERREAGLSCTSSHLGPPPAAGLLFISFGFVGQGPAASFSGTFWRHLRCQQASLERSAPEPLPRCAGGGAPAPWPCVKMEPLDSTPCWLPSLPAHFPEITSHELFTLRSSQEPSLRQEVPALFMRSDSGLLAAPGTACRHRAGPRHGLGRDPDTLPGG